MFSTPFVCAQICGIDGTVTEAELKFEIQNKAREMASQRKNARARGHLQRCLLGAASGCGSAGGQAGPAHNTQRPACGSQEHRRAVWG